ncbi:hypothetical protein ACFL2E_05330 [Thermodesulfobacteriota bacterium]
MQSGICKKCRKLEKCKAPCAPVEEYLREDNLTAFQRGGIGKHGEEIRVAMPRSREAQRSSLSQGHDKNGDPRTSSKDAQAFSTENENPFMQFEANKKQTSVFIKRFFGKWSYEDIAQAHDISIDAARKIYYAGVQRLLAVIIEMDHVHKSTPEAKKKPNRKKSNKPSPSIKKKPMTLEDKKEYDRKFHKQYYKKNKERIKAARRARYAAQKKAKK